MTPRSTKSELARALKVHRSQLDGFLARPGAPSPDAKKRYDSAAVADFISAQSSGGSLDTLRAARLEEVKLRCEKLRRELDADAKLTVKLSSVAELHGRMAVALRSLLLQRLTCEFPQKNAGADALALRIAGTALADELINKLAGDIETWNDAPANTPAA